MNNKINKNGDPAEVKQISFRRLVMEALPEMWSFQLRVTIFMLLMLQLTGWLIDVIINSSGTAFTTANMRYFVLSWRMPVTVLLGGFLAFLFVTAEVFVQIFLADDIMTGRRSGFFSEVRRGIAALKRFLTPAGILTMLYVIIAVPLGGIGFSISLTEALYIPNFIQEFIFSRPMLILVYLAVILVLIIIGYRYLFTMHAVLLDGMTPRQGMRVSAGIMKLHRRKLVARVIKALLMIGMITFAGHLLFRIVPLVALEIYGMHLPPRLFVDPLAGELGDQEMMAVIYRSLCVLVLLMGGYLCSVISLLGSSYLMLMVTRLYRDWTGQEQEMFPERPKRFLYRFKIVRITAVFLVLALLAVLIGGLFSQIFPDKEPVNLIAHRAGGTMASENSLEGLQAAIDHGCHGSEIDVQRTADNHYIINHDNTFKRLTGVDRKPQDMTMEEISQLRITDTTGSGAQLPVVTIEEMLDFIKDREILYIELKGATADRQMADDLVRIVREKDCQDDIVFISLNYDVINYIETNYPEFETGTLFFAGLGNITSLNCDCLIMEEEMATENRIEQIHEAGKKAIVWTVNTETGLYKFLDSNADGIITDEIVLAEKVQQQLDDRTDLSFLADRFSDVWE